MKKPQNSNKSQQILTNHAMEETTMRKVRDLPQCPFWRELAGNRIGCEGITPHSTLSLQFTNRAERLQQEAVFCCKHYSKCELYRAIFEAKYSGDLDGPLDTSPLGAL